MERRTSPFFVGNVSSSACPVLFIGLMIVPEEVVLPVKLIATGTNDSSKFTSVMSSGMEFTVTCNFPTLLKRRIGGIVVLLSVMLTLWKAVWRSLASW